MFDYKQSIKENTVGHILFITYSINNKTTVSQQWFSTKDSLLVHMDNWQAHFDKQSDYCNENGLDYCYSMTILRAVHFKSTNDFMSTTMTRQEFIEEMKETKVIA